MALAPQQSLLAQIQNFTRLSNSQKIGIIIGLAAIIALISGGWLWYQTPNYRVLFSNLSDRDGGAIIASLQQMNVPYKMAEGGGAIMVPAEQVYEVRLRLASQGLPKGSVAGFELLENQKLGISQFLEQINYQRALEGELTRSIQSLSAVQSARVHLAIPRPSVFIREQQKPSASVLLTLAPGKVLDPSQVAGIVHLVASSIPDMPVQNVTVVDQNGNLLVAQGVGGSKTGLDSTQLDYVGQLEQGFARRIESIISPITGQENVHAQVTADLDFSQTEQTAETYKPNIAPPDVAIRSQQINETSGSSGASAAGVPGALSNQPPGAASAPITAPTGATATGTGTAQGGETHKESTVNYELDKTIKHTKLPVGSIRRLSVAVVVNYKKVTDKTGKVAYKALSQAEMTQINNLVKETMGFDQQRGDTLNVVNSPFNIEEKAPEEEAPVWQNPAVVSNAYGVIKFIAIGGIIAYLVFGVLRPLLKELARPPKRPEALETGAPMEAPRGPGYADNLQAAKEIARQEPRAVANVVKDWIGKE